MLVTKLPSAKEMAEVLLVQVFHLHSFPRDMVSDRGPQFVPRFWQEFCKLVGTTVSLSSPPVQWPNRADEPGAGVLPPLPLLPQPCFLEQVDQLGVVLELNQRQLTISLVHH